MAGNKDMWLHTKDIPGSHVIVQCGGAELSEQDIFEAAAIAAYHSKARTSENVPVDYVPVRNVKKPAGAKIPGIQMISFGPTVVSPHSPKERAQVSTISMVADFIVDLFKTYR